MLRTTQESENTRHYSTPSYAVSNAPLQAGSQRYNAPAYQQALDVAVRLRSTHPGIIPPQEIEDAALELGIEPRLIHEALAALQPQTAAYPTYQAPPVLATTVYAQEALPTREEARREMGLMFGIPVIFSFVFTALTSLLMVAFGRMIGNSLTISGLWLLMATLVPAALCFFLGMNLRKKRQGAIAGILVGIGAGIAASVAAGISHLFDRGLALALLGAVLGGSLGAIGTALGRSLYAPSDRR